jgi:hypothetical protein
LDRGVEPVDIIEVIVIPEGALGNLKYGDEGRAVDTGEVQDDFYFVDIVDEGRKVVEVIPELVDVGLTIFHSEGGSRLEVVGELEGC